MSPEEAKKINWICDNCDLDITESAYTSITHTIHGDGTETNYCHFCNTVAVITKHVSDKARKPVIFDNHEYTLGDKPMSKVQVVKDNWHEETDELIGATVVEYLNGEFSRHKDIGEVANGAPT